MLLEALFKLRLLLSCLLILFIEEQYQREKIHCESFFLFGKNGAFVQSV
ncbi:hypothetical protein STRDD11_02761 [Streptococcus sp. DD11]|nr:hypothetical protein STRDD11_02761 [Streptococcus sp. DD11]